MNAELFEAINRRAYGFRSSVSRLVEDEHYQTAADRVDLLAEVDRLRAQVAAIAVPLSEPIRMDAYYYGFEETGVAIIDRILSAVAKAGKGYHHTENWTESDPKWLPVSYAQQIQDAANDAASKIAALTDSEAQR